MNFPSNLLSLTTAVPENRVSKTNLLELCDAFFSDRHDEYAELRPLLENTGIDERYYAKPLEWYLNPRDLKERTDAYIEIATRLFAQTAGSAIEEAALKPSEIDVVVLVSSTGISTPTIDVRAAEQVGFRSDITHVPVFGYGCAGGVAGLSLAEQLAQANPGSNVLLVALELCSLSYRPDLLNSTNLVCTALFSDGVAAAVISAKPQTTQTTIGRGAQHIWPATTHLIGWKIDPVGFEAVLDRTVPPFTRRHLKKAFDIISEKIGLGYRDFSRLLFHPGGKRILDAIEATFKFDSQTLDHERGVLSGYGNMSSPTALFVLRKALDRGLEGRTLLSAFGPGFTMNSMPVEVSA